MGSALEEIAMNFPAAHSMDTTWFAVDADGCVGVFDTGEDGALPNAASNGGGCAEPTFDTFLFDASRLAIAIVADPDLADTFGLPPPTSTATAARDERVVVVVADPRLTEGSDSHRSSPATVRGIEEAFPGADWTVIRAAEPRVLASANAVTRTDWEALARRRDVRAVIGESEFYELLEEAGGVFKYRHDYGDDGYQPGLYAREKDAPVEALTLSDLPPQARQELEKGLVFPFRFADTAHLQLADVLGDEECAIWAEDMTLRGAPLQKGRKPVPSRDARPDDGAPRKTTPQNSAPQASSRGMVFGLVALMLAIVALILWRSR